MELHFNDVYGMRCELRLLSGRTLTLERLSQEMTYRGLLMGTPNHEFNEEKLAGLRSVREGHPPTHLIQPRRRDYHLKAGDMASVTKRSPHHIPEWLPNVTCLASFRSFPAARDKDQDASILNILWFQDEFALPIAAEVLEQIATLDWDGLAQDISY